MKTTPLSSSRRPRVLVVDDQEAMAETLADGLIEHGYDATPCTSGQRAAQLWDRDAIDALVTDLRMPGMDGLDLLTAARARHPHRPVIVMTAYGAIESAMESVRRGAYHYLTKPFPLEELAIFLDRALEQTRLRHEAQALKTTLREQFSRAHLVGNGRSMQRVFNIVDRVAATDIPILITGETGTGKGLLARAIHAESTRASGRFVTVNCAALPETLLESELFGHRKGAFTGATANRSGLFVEAEGGTLFLDEIGETSPALQSKLLDVLERNVVRSVGATSEQAVNVRILAATHRDLRTSVQEGTFREDLLYRLEVVPIELPSLRERREDLPLLLDHFLHKHRSAHGASPVQRLSPGAMAVLLDYRWPGNVRELSHLLERLVLLGTSAEIGIDELPTSLRHNDPGASPTFTGDILPIRELQRRYARWALSQLGGSRLRTAERLGVDRKTFAKWVSDDENDDRSPDEN